MQYALSAIVFVFNGFEWDPEIQSIKQIEQIPLFLLQKHLAVEQRIVEETETKENGDHRIRVPSHNYTNEHTCMYECERGHLLQTDFEFQTFPLVFTRVSFAVTISLCSGGLRNDLSSPLPYHPTL